jgi:putative ABC transport system permease protein
VTIAGLFMMGTSFAADGNAVTSSENFLRIFKARTTGSVDLGFIRVKSGADIAAIKQQLIAMMGDEIQIFTYPELIAFEKNYWEGSAPLGFIFGMGVVMGLIVGMVIVYQILFTDIANNLTQFATLKAMGYSHSYLIKVVFASSVFLAFLGFIPGFILSYGLYNLAESAIFIEFPMPLSKVFTVFAMIFTMCVFAGTLAMRKLKSANPADMF